MERRSPRLRRVLAILASQPAIQRLREHDNDEWRRWAAYKRDYNLPADADPYAGDWF